jgi:hypothetical protein
LSNGSDFFLYLLNNKIIFIFSNLCNKKAKTTNFSPFFFVVFDGSVIRDKNHGSTTLVFLSLQA